MNKETIRKQVTGAMFVVGAAVASSYGVTKYLLKAALDRESPKAPKRAGNMISKSNKGDDYLSASREASKKLSEASHEIVRIKSFDNIELLGHWFPAQNPKRIIIAMHGWRSSWNRDFGLISEFWLNSGCSILFAEQRGQNGSGGDYMGFGMIERFDCKSWCEWAAEKDESSPIYLAGVSMGAASVLMASNLPLSDRVHGIMADCGFTSARAIWKHVANNNLHIAYEIRSSIADSICRRKIHMSPDEVTTTDALSETDKPVLFVHGSDDHFVPVSMTYENYLACHSDKRILIVPGADHCMSYYQDRKQYEQTVRAFWNEYDGNDPRK